MTSGTRTWLISPSSQVTILLPPPPAYPPHSVTDLHRLLTARGHQMDYQLYNQAAILHNMLRKVSTTLNTSTRWNTDYIRLQELDSVTVKPSDDSSPTFAVDYSSTSNPILLLEPASSTFSKDQGENICGSPSTFSSLASQDNAPGSWNILTSEDHHVYSIFCILLIIIFLFFIILFIIIFRCKGCFQKRSKGKNGITK
jgi:hypothetical protein